jgi:class 3 adenylate cyclase
MPLYIDIHNLPGVKVKDVAHAHQADLQGQAVYGVNHLKYWFNEEAGKVFCLCTAPNKEAAIALHKHSTGMAPDNIIEVEPGNVTAFLGPIPESETGAATVEEAGRSFLDGGFRTVFFSDVEGSTALTQRLGDEGAMRLLRVHDFAVRGALSSWNGREIKHMGDGIMAAFVSASKAVGCAIQVQQALEAHNQAHADDALNVRIGLSAGEPLEDSNDLFGVTVQLAARVCAHARPRQILVTNVVSELCAGKGYRFTSLGTVPLKGFDAPTLLHEAAWRGSDK